MSKLSKALEAMVEVVGDKDEKIVKKHPIRKDWLAKRAEFVRVKDEAEELRNKAITLKLGLWSMVEQDLGVYSKRLGWNDEEGVIEEYE